MENTNERINDLKMRVRRMIEIIEKQIEKTNEVINTGKGKDQ